MPYFRFPVSFVVIASAIATVIVIPIQLVAQDSSLQTNFGETTLASGFEDDPHIVSLYAGGVIDLSESTEFSCIGFVGEAPDFRTDYSIINGNYTLSFFADSDADTTLLINAPDGRWYCNDDFSEDFGPMPGIEFKTPLEGIYDVWVGVYDEDEMYAKADLFVTEVGDQLLGESTDADDSTDTPRRSGSGTAFVISESGHLITNHHVITGCETITFQLPGETAIEASVIASNPEFDLALLKANLRAHPAEFRSQNRLRLGDEIVVYGFPLLGDLSSQGNITSGVVSALTGLNDDLSTFQISAQIQPGNSGGPVFDRYGGVIGVVVSMINDEYFAQQSGTIPQNINFAITANITRAFLETNNIDYLQTNQKKQLSIADIAENAQAFTGAIVCFD